VSGADLRRLAAAAESLELQARELRAEVRELSDRLGAAPQADVLPSSPAKPPMDAAPAEAAGSSVGAPDLDAARIVALNMALDGKPRDEVAGYLRDELGVTDSDALLDDVYARVG
jgi:hypothetical protein